MVVVLRKDVEFNLPLTYTMILILFLDCIKFFSVIAAATNLSS